MNRSERAVRGRSVRGLSVLGPALTARAPSRVISRACLKRGRVLFKRCARGREHSQSIDRASREACRGVIMAGRPNLEARARTLGDHHACTSKFYLSHGVALEALARVRFSCASLRGVASCRSRSDRDAVCRSYSMCRCRPCLARRPQQPDCVYKYTGRD